VDDLDYRILQALQSDFPLSRRPYQSISDSLKIPCEQLMERLRSLTEDGVIRRMGASLDSRKLGCSSTLAAISIESHRVDEASAIIERFPEITHSYLRSDRFNIWFTVIASDAERVESVLKEIQSALSLQDSQILNLPVKRLFKLNASFNISEK
jgi:DNA-binding Lrp family transcriptional regulator